jgi:hypothetical protein
MSKFVMLLRELAKENVLPRAYFDAPRSLYECCAATARHGSLFKMVPSRTIRLNGQNNPPRLLHASPIDPIQDYKIDPTADITEYYIITAVNLDQVAPLNILIGHFSSLFFFRIFPCLFQRQFSYFLAIIINIELGCCHFSFRLSFERGRIPGIPFTTISKRIYRSYTSYLLAFIQNFHNFLFLLGEMHIPHALAVEPWRVIGPLQPHLVSLLNDARATHAAIVAEEQKLHRRRYAKLKNFFERLQKKSSRKLRFEDL